MRKKSELVINALLPFVDFVAIVSAYVFAYIIRVRIVHRPVPFPTRGIVYLKIFLVLLPVWIFIFALLGLYTQSNIRSRFEEWSKVFVGVSAGTAFLIMLDFFSRTPIFPSRSIPIYGYILSIALVIIGREIIRLVQHFGFRFGYGIHNVLLVGSGPIAQGIFESIQPTARTGFRVVAVLDKLRISSRRFKGVKAIKNIDELGDLKIEQIIQADSALPQEEVMGLISYANNRHITYQFVPNQFGLFATNSRVNSFAGEYLIEVMRTPLDGWGRIIKRLFDVVGAGLGLVILSPVFLAIAIAIRLNDNGPIFYTHERLSREGGKAGILKFRSMYWRYSPGPGRPYKTPVEALKAMGRNDLVEEFQANQKLANDPRVMPVGKFLRRTSLDELPQLVNVLKGQMSLVGPRPIVNEELSRYGKQSQLFLTLKPGLTGLWQISGRSDLGYDERVKLDIYYVEHWSLWLDIKILLKTVVTVIKKAGAY